MNERFLMKTFNWTVSYWLRTLEGVASGLCSISVQPNNLDHAPPLKELWSLVFSAAELISKDFSGNGDSKLHNLCVAPSLV